MGFDQNQKPASSWATEGPQRCVTHKEDVTTGIIIKLSNNRISERDQKEIVALNSGKCDPTYSRIGHDGIPKIITYHTTVI